MNGPGNLKRGQRIAVTYHQQTVPAMVVLASANGRSVMLHIEDALVSPSGGAFVGLVPVLRDDDGVFRDIVEQAEVTIVPLAGTTPTEHTKGEQP